MKHGNERGRGAQHVEGNYRHWDDKIWEWLSAKESCPLDSVALPEFIQAFEGVSSGEERFDDHL